VLECFIHEPKISLKHSILREHLKSVTLDSLNCSGSSDSTMFFNWSQERSIMLVGTLIRKFSKCLKYFEAFGPAAFVIAISVRTILTRSSSFSWKTMKVHICIVILIPCLLIGIHYHRNRRIREFINSFGRGKQNDPFYICGPCFTEFGSKCEPIRSSSKRTSINNEVKIIQPLYSCD